MNITFEGKYKSIETFSWESIPQFAVITGRNGSGKTQLLELFSAGITKKWLHKLSDGIFPEISNQTYRIEDVVFLNGRWSLEDNRPIGMAEIEQERSRISKQIVGRYDYLRTPIPGASVDSNHIQRNIELESKQRSRTLQNDFIDEILQKDNLILKTKSTLLDIIKDLPLDNFITLSEQASNHRLGREFYNYNLDLIVAKSQGRSEEDFQKQKSVKPWIRINKLLDDFGLPYRINDIEDQDIREKYHPHLVSTSNGDRVLFNELSSGESVLVSLVMWLFNSSINKVFPKILLLDEPDAFLHPIVIKEFIRVVKNVLCDQYGVRVIMTTHSPTTVALVPEESLFVMEKGDSQISNVSRDFALGILTEGIPSFSVNYENRRQVFVESPYDAIFYEKIYNILQDKLNPEISLTFISSGASWTDSTGLPAANCDQVKNICKILREAGNQFIWGIIDWDTTNEPNEFDYVKVVGEGSRYAIENYLFDPIILANLLVREKLVKNDSIGLEENESFLNFQSFSDVKLQEIADVVVEKIRSFVKPQDNSELINTSYIDGRQIQIPKWYLEEHGHTLEQQILRAFPGLGKLKRDKEELLKLEIINKVFDDMPGLIPLDILNTFISIQKI